MKYTIYLKRSFAIVLFFLFIMQVFSQHTLQSNLNIFRPEDVIIKQQVSYKDPGRSGENVLWDFSQLETVDEEYDLAYFNQGDSLTVGIEHHTKYYYSLSNDSLLLWGFENPTTILKNTQPELLMKFPVHYKDRVQTYYHGTGRYCDRLSLDAMGTTETVADAYGMMILPDKDTLKHVIRTHTFKRIAEDTQSLTYSLLPPPPVPVLSSDSIDYRLQTDTVVLELETCRWYVEGYRYPVFETVKSREIIHGEAKDFFCTAFFYPPQEHYYLDEDEENLAILEALQKEEENSANRWEGLTYNCYPNPVVTTLDVEMYLPKTANNIRVQLSDRQGRMLTEENWGAKPEGIFTGQVYMEPYPRGEYILNISLDGYKVSEILMKR